MEVHPPEHGIHSWRDFLVHMGTITLGLLIAIGLEQSVEWLHHRHQVAAIRHDLEVERSMNLVAFQTETLEWRRQTAALQDNLRTIIWLRTHHGAPPSSWPARMHWFLLGYSPFHSAWDTALRSSALEYMPRSEVQAWSNFYGGLQEMGIESEKFYDAFGDAKLVLLRGPDLQHLEPGDLAKEYDYQLQMVLHQAKLGVAMRNFSGEYPAFKGAPTNAELYSLGPPAPDAEDVKAASKLEEKEDKALKEIEKDDNRNNSR